MDATEVLELLSANRNERGVAKWTELGLDATGLSTFGIGLTQLRRLAKQVGRSHDLAKNLWASDVYDAKVVAVLVDDPRAMTRAQAEAQVDEVGAAQLAHVFSSCDSSLAKTPFVVELVEEWTRSEDPLRRSCGYGLLSEVARFEGRKAPDDEYYLEHVRRIDRTIAGEGTGTRLAMGNALMAIGKRNAELNAEALRVANAVGPIEFESPSGRCEPFDVAKHLTTDRLREKLGIRAAP